MDAGVGGTTTIANAISGSGSLTQDGSGRLILSGENSYSGDTTVSAGTLQVANANAIPSGAGYGNVEVDGTFGLNDYDITLNGLSGSGIVTTGASGAVTLAVGDNDQTSQFDGLILDGSGTIALTKLGAGTFVLTGTNSYSGATTVSAGILEASPLSSLPLTGEVTVHAGARWPSPASATLPPFSAIAQTSPTNRARTLGSTPPAATSPVPPTSAPPTRTPVWGNSAPAP